MYTVTISLKGGIDLTFSDEGFKIIRETDGNGFVIQRIATALLEGYIRRYTVDAGNFIDYVARNVAKDLKAVAIIYPPSYAQGVSQIVH